MTETLAHGYSYERTQRELSNEYQYDRVSMFFKDFCILELWAKVASAWDGLKMQPSVDVKVGDEVGGRTYLAVYAQ